MRHRGDVARNRAVDCRGVSLLEVIVAVGLLSGAVAGLAQLVAIAVRANLGARATTVSVVLATQKMEQLRARPDADRSPPGGSLLDDLPDFSDFFDGSGRPLPAGSGQPAAAFFVRRWSIQPLASDPGQSRVLEVRVLRVATANPAGSWPGSQPEEARFLTVITGKDR